MTDCSIADARQPMAKSSPEAAFTLLEMAVVLVIIGLIVGGVLVGQDLIKGAQVRAQVSQIEKLQSAVNTFYGKYGALPGDLNASIASRFGFTPRGSNPGQGDGNGIIATWNGSAADGELCDAGESGVFWIDLTTANGLNIDLIEGGFNTAQINSFPSSPVTGTALNNYYPAAKIGQGNYIYVSSKDIGVTTNLFGLAAIYESSGHVYANPGLTVKQAYDIDNKIDDGLPQSGNVRSIYLNFASGFTSPVWAGTAVAQLPYTSPTSGSTTSCFDNGGVTGATQQYSMEIANGNYVNCALSFKMQAGD